VFTVVTLKWPTPLKAEAREDEEETAPSKPRA